MQRLFSYLLILSYLCPYLNLVIFVDGADDAAASALCDKATLSTACANLGNVSYPFGDSEPCAISESFRISNCSHSSQAYWNAFMPALGSSEDKLGAPALTGIFSVGYLSYINLTWNLDSSRETHACDVPHPADAADAYIPKAINLTGFSNGSFHLSSFNHILLLNCSNLPSSLLQENDTVCHAYQEQCRLLQDTPCMQIPVPTQELMLHQALSNFSCSHFQFFVTATKTSVSISSWSQGLIQVFYGDVRCDTCHASGQSCVYSTTTSAFQACAACGIDEFSDTNCDHAIPRCNSFLCNKSAKIIVGVVTPVIAISLTIIGIVALNRCKKTSGYFTKTVPLNLAEISTRHKIFGAKRFKINQFDLEGLTEHPTEYQYASLVLATKEFSDFLGAGGFGAVYKGVLGNDTDDTNVKIAVKVLELRSKQSKKHFLNEVASLGRIHHVHVVRLLGFCIEESHEMLVYEYVINGSLDKWLFHQSGCQSRVLLWEERYGIAIGIARGLNYLHEECRHRIVHCDVKPQNILLDEQMRLKIADFGLARLMGREESRVATLARGTPGYMGPEFWLGGESQLSTKFDVYSYGMVLLELISGQRNFEHDVCVPEMAYEAAMKRNLESILDAKLGIARMSDRERIIEDDMLRQQVQTALLVALWCIQDHPTNRPSMSEVVQYLEGITSVNERPPQPAIPGYYISKSAQQPLHRSSGAHFDITPISGGR